MADHTWPITDSTPALPAHPDYREVEDSDAPLLGPAMGVLQQGTALEHLARSWAAAGEHATLVATLNHVAGGLQLGAELSLRTDRRVSAALERCENSYRYQGEALLRFEGRVGAEMTERFRNQDERVLRFAAQAEASLSQAERMHAQTVRAQATQGRRLSQVEARLTQAEDRLRGWQVIAAILLGMLLVVSGLLLAATT